MTLGPLMIDVAGQQLTPDDREILQHPLVGGVILFTRNYADPEQLAALVAAIKAARNPPLLVTVDHEGGRVQRFRSGFSVLPSARRLGHEFDADHAAGIELTRRMHWLMAAELRAVGIDLSYAPCVDLDYGVSSVIGDRALHRDADTVGRLAVAAMLGLRDAAMSAVAKHFPGHGAVVADSHHALPIDRRNLADLEPDLRPYHALIANELPAVMVAHVLFPEVDDLPASLSRRWIQGVLREHMHFAGAVFADDLSMAGATQFGGPVDRAQQALAAGCDVLPICNRREDVIAVLDGLRIDVDPALALRLVRLRGRGPKHNLAQLQSSRNWLQSRELLARSELPPSLKLG
jgi:beta-N-acetylhexosaminidase